MLLIFLAVYNRNTRSVKAAMPRRAPLPTRTATEKAASSLVASGLLPGNVIVVKLMTGDAPLVVTRIEHISVEGSDTDDVRVYVRTQNKKQAPILGLGQDFFDGSAYDIGVVDIEVRCF